MRNGYGHRQSQIKTWAKHKKTSIHIQEHISHSHVSISAFTMYAQHTYSSQCLTLSNNETRQHLQNDLSVMDGFTKVSFQCYCCCHSRFAIVSNVLSSISGKSIVFACQKRRQRRWQLWIKSFLPNRTKIRLRKKHREKHHPKKIVQKLWKLLVNSIHCKCPFEYGEVQLNTKLSVTNAGPMFLHKKVPEREKKYCKFCSFLTNVSGIVLVSSAASTL